MAKQNEKNDRTETQGSGDPRAAATVAGANPTEASEDARARAQAEQERATAEGQRLAAERNAGTRQGAQLPEGRRLRDLEKVAERTQRGRDRFGFGTGGGGAPVQQIPPLPEQQPGKPDPIVPRVMSNPPYVPENNPNPYPDAAGGSGAAIHLDPRDARVQEDPITGARTEVSPDAQRRVSGGAPVGPGTMTSESSRALGAYPQAPSASGAPPAGKPSGNP